MNLSTLGAERTTPLAIDRTGGGCVPLRGVHEGRDPGALGLVRVEPR